MISQTISSGRILGRGLGEVKVLVEAGRKNDWLRNAYAQRPLFFGGAGSLRPGGVIRQGRQN